MASSDRMTTRSTAGGGSFLDKHDSDFITRKNAKAELGRRNRLEKQFKKQTKDADVIVKTVVAETTCSPKSARWQPFEPNTNSDIGVIFSANKRKRWQQDPLKLIRDSEDPKTAVTERRMIMNTAYPSSCDAEASVVALHTKDEEGAVKTKRSKGRGTKLDILTKGEEAPETVINFVTANHNMPRLHGKMTHSQGTVVKARRTKCIKVDDDMLDVAHDNYDMDELPVSRLSNSENNQREPLTPSTCFKSLNLSDLVVPKPESNKRMLRSWAKVDHNIAYVEQSQSFGSTVIVNEMNESRKRRSTMVWTDVSVNAMAWRNASLQEQLLTYQSEHADTCRFLDEAKTFLLIDLTDRLSNVKEHAYGVPKAFLTIELHAEEKFVRFHLNSLLVNLTIPYKNQSFHHQLVCERHTIERAVEMVVKKLNSFTYDYYYERPELEEEGMNMDYKIEATYWPCQHRGTKCEYCNKKGERLNRNRNATSASSAERRSPAIMGKFGEHLLAVNSEQYAAATTRMTFSDVLKLIEESGIGEEPFETVHTTQACRYCHLDVKQRDTFLLNTNEGPICVPCLRQAVIEDMKLGKLLHFSICDIMSTMQCYALLQVLKLPEWIEVMEVLAKTLTGHERSKKCIGCKSLLLFDKTEFGTIACDYCRIAFCAECDREPHWPFSCEEWKEWSEDFDIKGELRSAGAENSLTLVKCHCKNVVKLPDGLQSDKCKSCQRLINISNMSIRMFVRWGIHYKRWCAWYRGGETPTALLPPDAVFSLKPERQIPNAVFELCSNAQKLRFASEWRHRLASVLKNSDENQKSSDFVDIAKTALWLSEQMVAYSFVKRSPTATSNKIKKIASAIIEQANKLQQVDSMEKLQTIVDRLKNGTEQLRQF